MRILIIGGTAFVGRHITQAAIDAGHEVTLLHRGRTGADLFPGARHLTADRDGDLGALDGREWDAAIDVSAYRPGQVRALARALDGRGGRYLFISSTSVYRPLARPFFTESAPLAELDDPERQAVTAQTYGGLKVACERAAAGQYGADRVTIIRPAYVIGPHDYTCRFTWWVQRIASGGTVLAPGDPAAPIQVIDARDLAAWTVTLAQNLVPGTFHAVSPPPPFSFAEMLTAIADEVGPPGTELRWVAGGFLQAAGETGASLPLWPDTAEERSLNMADPAAALAAGLRPRALRDSIADIRRHELRSPTPVPGGTGLAPQREAELLSRWQGRPQADR